MAGEKMDLKDASMTALLDILAGKADKFNGMTQELERRMVPVIGCSVKAEPNMDKRASLPTQAQEMLSLTWDKLEAAEKVLIRSIEAFEDRVEGKGSAPATDVCKKDSVPSVITLLTGVEKTQERLNKLLICYTSKMHMLVSPGPCEAKPLAEDKGKGVAHVMMHLTILIQNMDGMIMDMDYLLYHSNALGACPAPETVKEVNAPRRY